MKLTLQATLIAGACALAACSNNGGGNDSNLVLQNDMAPVTVPANGMDMNGVSADNVDTAFLTDAIKGDNSEVQLGQLAQQKGASQGVKEFGQTLVTDHGKAKEQAAQLAQQAGMQVPDGIKDGAKQEMTKLQGLSGADFDKEFASYMVQDHKKDIDKFQQQANGTGPTAQLAQQSLPTLKKHLQMAQSLQK